MTDNLEEARADLAQLLDSQAFAVLATSDGERPYGNLIAFAVSADMTRLLFVTPRATRKYANLTSNNQVALIFDNRSNDPADVHSAMACTARGRARELVGQEKEQAAELYIARHPHLREFIASPHSALFAVEVETYYLVRRFQEVMELRVCQ